MAGMARPTFLSKRNGDLMMRVKLDWRGFSFRPYRAFWDFFILFSGGLRRPAISFPAATGASTAGGPLGLREETGRQVGGLIG